MKRQRWAGKAAKSLNMRKAPRLGADKAPQSEASACKGERP
jgi:hypothetical protein